MKNSVNFYKGKFGLERETLRVDSHGRLAQTPHPFGNDEHITRDFCENQVKLVTSVCESIGDALAALAELDEKTRNVLAENGENIWLYSNPPHFDSEADIPIADFVGDHSSKRSYREVLEQKYGKRLMLFSGIHFNFSFSEEFLRELNTNNEDFRHFRDALYLRLYKQLMLHSFLLVLLTASSPYYDASLDGDGKSGIILSEYSSLRNSKRGYWNKFLPILDHRDLRTFTGSIQKHIVTGIVELRLNNNIIDSSSVQSIANLTKLEYLSLSGNSVVDLGFLQDLVYLTHLELARCNIRQAREVSGKDQTTGETISEQIDNLSYLSGMKDLVILDLSDNPEIHNIASLSTLTKLGVFYMNNVELESAAAVRSMTKLQYLSMQNSGLTDFSFLNTLNQLEFLNLAGHKFAAFDFRNIRNYDNLVGLFLDSATETEAININTFTNKQNLRYLALANVNVGSVDSLPDMF